MVSQRSGIVERIVRHRAIGGGAESWQPHEAQRQRRYCDDLTRPGHQQVAELREVLRPVRDDLRRWVEAYILGNGLGGSGSFEARAHQASWNRVEIWQNVTLDPLMWCFGRLKREVKLVRALFRHQCEADQRSAESIELRVEKIAHKALLARLVAGANVGFKSDALSATFFHRAQLAASFLILFPKLAPPFLVGFGLAGGRGVDSGGHSFDRQRHDIHGSFSDRSDNATGQQRRKRQCKY
jgi:hypothetical protein